jgi:alpha-tubulin suppressor-like RCC1 family protein
MMLGATVATAGACGSTSSPRASSGGGPDGSGGTNYTGGSGGGPGSSGSSGAAGHTGGLGGSSTGCAALCPPMVSAACLGGPASLSNCLSGCATLQSLCPSAFGAYSSCFTQQPSLACDPDNGPVASACTTEYQTLITCALPGTGGAGGTAGAGGAAGASGFGGSGGTRTVCGDGLVTTGETCDGLNVAGVSCANYSPTLLGGELRCDASCSGYDTSFCTTLSLAAGNGHACAVLPGNQVKCWGHNIFGQLGLGDTPNRGDQPNEMGAALAAVASNVSLIAAGDIHNCALFTDGTVKCWGDNRYGQLGLGDISNRGDTSATTVPQLPAVSLSSTETVTSLSAHGYFTCALLTGGKVKCWGNGQYGELGLGDTANRGTIPGQMGDSLPYVDLGLPAVTVATGGSHACAILSSGALKCWGRNLAGALGLGDVADRGDNPGEMGTALPAVNLGSGRVVVALALGSFHSCALLSDGSVKCWGYAMDGELGLGDVNARGRVAGQMGDALPAVDLGTGRTARSISANGQHTCAVLDDGSVKCWGHNFYGELGLGDTVDRGNAAGQMGDNLPAVDLGGMAAVSVVAGYHDTCATLRDATVRCWGYNNDGELGLGDTTNRGNFPGQMGSFLPVTVLE